MVREQKTPTTTAVGEKYNNYDLYIIFVLAKVTANLTTQQYRYNEVRRGKKQVVIKITVYLEVKQNVSAPEK